MRSTDGCPLSEREKKKIQIGIQMMCHELIDKCEAGKKGQAGQPKGQVGKERNRTSTADEGPMLKMYEMKAFNF